MQNPSHSTLELLKKRHFLPFFITQFLGALNDNTFKYALIGLITFQLAQFDLAESVSANTLINLSAGLFILPFFLFSAFAGQLADIYDKAKLIRYIKLFEILLMSLAAILLALNYFSGLFVILFLMGTQSSFFGPVKYSILPQHLSEADLIGGNALVEAGTFIAILLGTIAGTLLINHPTHGATWVAATIVVLALLGWLSARAIPHAPAESSNLRFSWNLPKQTWDLMRTISQRRSVLLSVLGVSWFWFFGALILTQVPLFAKDTLGGDQQVVTLLLSTFTVGLALGSLLCKKASGQVIEIGLVPLGALGMAIFTFDLGAHDWANVASGSLSLSAFFEQQGFRAVLDIALLSLFAGLYIVPLYAIIQVRSEAHERSRAIAGMNVVNALFMVLSAVMAMVLLKYMSIAGLLITVACMHVAITLFIFTLVPEFFLRLIGWVLMHTIYRVRYEGLEHLPKRGPAVIVSNHVSYIDAILIGSMCRRPIRYVMYHKIFKVPFLSRLFKLAKAIPIAPAKENPELLANAYADIAQTLEQGGLIGLFPEGRLTRDGTISEFKPGIEKIIQATPVPVVPIVIHNLWGSFFTHHGGLGGWPRKLRAHIQLKAGEPIAPSDVNATYLKDKVCQLKQSLTLKEKTPA